LPAAAAGAILGASMSQRAARCFAIRTRAASTPRIAQESRMLGIVAKLTIKPGTEKEFEAIAKELVAKVRANEPGCHLYALHRGETPNTYVFMERYADQAAVDAHRATEHFKTLGRKMGEYMEGRAEVMRLAEVD
jgi:quinol monooxygenase YgiN